MLRAKTVWAMPFALCPLPFALGPWPLALGPWRLSLTTAAAAVQPSQPLGILSTLFSTGLAVSHCGAYWRMNSLALSCRAVSHAS